MSHAIDIDLGTANTSVAVYRNNKFEIIPHEGWILPSCVAFNNRGRLIGQTARTRANVEPKCAVFGALSFLGLKHHDPTVQSITKNLPFEVTPKEYIFEAEQIKYFKVVYKRVEALFTPVEILAMVLKRAKKDGESYLGREN